MRTLLTAAIVVALARIAVGSFDGYPWAIGKCTAMSPMGFSNTTRDDANATRCPCFTAKADDKTLSD
jgi:hypothetical protein